MNLKELSSFPGKVRKRAETFVRRTWMKYALRGVSQADAHGRLDLAYTVPDPWHMDSEPERHRFAETNRLLHKVLIDPSPRLGTILEIGCGEGHQSEHLVKLCDHLVGIDVSPTAIDRARKRVPGAEFVAGDLFAQPWIDEPRRYDLVTAFEVLYYLSDIPKTLAAMSRLGKACMVTYYGPTSRVVDPALATVSLAGRDTFRFGDTEWKVAWWRNG